MVFVFVLFTRMLIVIFMNMDKSIEVLSFTPDKGWSHCRFNGKTSAIL